MANTRTHHAPLLIEWTPTAVRLVDPASGTSFCAPSILEALQGQYSGRTVVVAVSQRSAYVRTLAVPNVTGEELGRLIGAKLAPLLPFKAGEYVFGFRLADVKGAGRLAVAAAMKTESLRRIHEECERGSLKVAAVLPLAFGSWLAARASSLGTCAVVEAGDDSIAIDVIGSGELCYSRTVQLPETSEQLEEEIFRTVGIAGAPSAVVLGDARLALRDQRPMGKEAILYLADIPGIEKQLFSFELPEKVQARQRKGTRGVAQRAVVAALLAMACVAFEFVRQSNAQATLSGMQRRDNADLLRAQAQNSAALLASRQVQDSASLLGTAFKPVQGLSDVASVIAAATPKDVWFTGLTVERGKPVIIRGVTANGKSVADFVGELNKNPRFRSMKVVSATKGTVGKSSVIQFAVSGTATGLLPIDQLIKREPKRP